MKGRCSYIGSSCPELANVECSSYFIEIKHSYTSIPKISRRHQLTHQKIIRIAQPIIPDEMANRSSQSNHNAEDVNRTNDPRTSIDPHLAAMMTTRTIEELGIDLDGTRNSDKEGVLPIFQNRGSPAFDQYLTDNDTGSENSSLPPSRRWVWYCKLRDCPQYWSTWTCKSNFLLHLYESPQHRADTRIKTRQGRRQLSASWKEETAYHLSEPKKLPPPP